MTTQKRLFDVLSYDFETGVFTSKKTRKIIGSMRGIYLRLKVDGVSYSAHRLAWLYVHGKLPSAEIDHIDGIKTNNARNNLRDVTVSINRQNLRSAKSNNKVGLLGVSFHGKAYRARIKCNGVQKVLGTFPSKEDAYDAYLNAKRNLHAGCTL